MFLNCGCKGSTILLNKQIFTQLFSHLTFFSFKFLAISNKIDNFAHDLTHVQCHKITKD